MGGGFIWDRGYRRVFFGRIPGVVLDLYFDGMRDGRILHDSACLVQYVQRSTISISMSRTFLGRKMPQAMK